MNDPHRHPQLDVLMKRPFDAQSPFWALSTFHYTPNNLFYVRQGRLRAGLGGERPGEQGLR